MTVYVVQKGCYENEHIAGIYTTPEAAMAAHPIPPDFKYPDVPSASNLSRPGGWKRHERTYDGKTYVSWSNGLDWDSAAEITPYEVET